MSLNNNYIDKKFFSPDNKDRFFLNSLSHSFKRNYSMTDMEERMNKINNYFSDLNNSAFKEKLFLYLKHNFSKNEFNNNLIIRFFLSKMFLKNNIISVIPGWILLKINLSLMLDFIELNNLFCKKNNLKNNCNEVKMISVEFFREILVNNEMMFYFSSILDISPVQFFLKWVDFSKELDLTNKNKKNFNTLEVFPKKIFFDYNYKKEIELDFSIFRYYFIQNFTLSSSSYLLMGRNFYIFFIKKKKEYYTFVKFSK